MLITCVLTFFGLYQARLAAVKEKFGRDLCVFETLGPSLSLSQVSNDGMNGFNLNASYQGQNMIIDLFRTFLSDSLIKCYLF